MALLTVEAAIDSHMNQRNPGTNYGYLSSVNLGTAYSLEEKTDLWRAIGNFDVTALAGATINSAKLVRHVFELTGGGADAYLSRCTRPADWVQGEVTWNEYRTGNSWTNGGGDFDDVGPPAKIDYTEPTATGDQEITGLEAFVEDALENRGGIVAVVHRLANEAPGSSTYYRWRSVQHGSDVWRLVIDYTPAAGWGRLADRGFLRGVQRGVLRGV